MARALRVVKCISHTRPRAETTAPCHRSACQSSWCINCGSTFADRPTAQNHVVNSLATGKCTADRSHMPWALDDVTSPMKGNVCATKHLRLATLLRTCAPDTRFRSRADNHVDTTCRAFSTTQTPPGARSRWTRAGERARASSATAVSTKSEAEGFDEQAVASSRTEAPAEQRESAVATPIG